MQQIQTLDEFYKLPEGTKVTVHFLARNASDVLTVHAGRLVSETGFTSTLLEAERWEGYGVFRFNMSGHTIQDSVDFQLVGLSVEQTYDDVDVRFHFTSETCQDDVDISELFDPENFLEGTFRKLCDEFNLEHGDIAPLQAFRLDELGLEIKDILTSFVKQNLPEVEQTCDDADARFQVTPESFPCTCGGASIYKETSVNPNGDGEDFLVHECDECGWLSHTTCNDVDVPNTTTQN